MSATEVSTLPSNAIIVPHEEKEGINQLPAEILHHIFSFLNRDLSALTSTSVVSKQWRQIVFGVELPDFFSAKFSTAIESYRPTLRDHADYIPTRFLQANRADDSIELGKFYRLPCAPGFYVVYSADSQTVFFPDPKTRKPVPLVTLQRAVGDIIYWVKKENQNVYVLTKEGFYFVRCQEGDHAVWKESHFMDGLKKIAERHSLSNLKIQGVENRKSLHCSVGGANSITSFNVDFSFADSDLSLSFGTVYNVSICKSTDFRIVESKDFFVRINPDDLHIHFFLTFIEKKTRKIVHSLEIRRLFILDCINENEFIMVTSRGICQRFSLIENGEKKLIVFAKNFSLLSLIKRDDPTVHEEIRHIYGVSHGRCLCLSGDQVGAPHSISWIDLPSRSVIAQFAFPGGSRQEGAIYEDRAVILSENDDGGERDIATIYHFNQKNHSITKKQFSLRDISSKIIGFNKKSEKERDLYCYYQCQFEAIKMLGADYFVTLLSDVEGGSLIICGISLITEKTTEIVRLPYTKEFENFEYLASFVLCGNKLVFTLDDQWQEKILYIYNLTTGKRVRFLAEQLHPEKNARIESFKIEKRDGVESIVVRMKYKDYQTKTDIIDLVDVKAVGK